MGYKFIKQDGIKDCGCSILYNMIRYHGGNVDVEELRNLVKTTKDGTSVYHIVETSKKLGLNSKCFKCNINDLHSIKPPFVVHINVENKYPHFVIIKKIVDDEVHIFDPIRGNIKYDIDLFSDEWSNIIITFEKTSKLVNRKNNYKKNIIFLLMDNKKKLLFLLFLSILGTFFTTVNSLFFQSLLDNINNIEKSLLIFITFTLLSVILNYIRNNNTIKYNNKIDSKLTYDVYKKILNLPLIYHHSRPTGDVISRIYDLNYIKDFVSKISFSIIIDISIFIFILIYLFLLNVSLAFISIIFIIFYTLVYLYYRKDIKALNYKVQEKQSKINSTLVESLVGINTVKNLNLENYIYNYQVKLYDDYLYHNSSLNKKYNTFNNILNLITDMQLIFSLYVGVILIRENTIKISQLISFILFLNILINTIQNLYSFDSLIINSKNSYRRLEQLFSIVIKNKKGISKAFSKNIKFVDINFSYNGVNDNLKNFNFVINRNDYILVTGKSGSGKSTIFKLLTKQINLQSGNILLDNVSIDKYDYDYIRSRICLVSQKEFIFTDSIKNNIILDRKPSDKELNKAIKVSMVDQILKNKNIDLNYLLEEDGHNLSGGERQKILIARTLIRNTDYIIFDETMNEIDIESERKIIENIKTEYNKTIILISHRDNNIDLFNKHLVVGGEK